MVDWCPNCMCACHLRANPDRCTIYTKYQPAPVRVNPRMEFLSGCFWPILASIMGIFLSEFSLGELKIILTLTAYCPKLAALQVLLSLGMSLNFQQT